MLVPIDRKYSAVALFTVICVLCSPVNVQAKENSESGKATRNGIDIVFLVDISKSMDDFFKVVRGSLIEYVQKALLGDRIIIITFGDKSHLKVKRSIKNQSDRRAIIRAIKQIHPSDYSTYIVLALQHGLKELAELKEKGSENIKFLILITDGKNNPPKYITNPLKFDTILKSYENFRPGQDWFMHYITLKPDVDDNATLAFSRQVGSSILNIENSSLSECISSTHVPVLIQIIETHNLVMVRENGKDSWLQTDIDPDKKPLPLRMGDCVKTGTDGRAKVELVSYGLMGVDLDTEFEVNRARRNPITESVDISIQLKRGKTENLLEASPTAKAKFEIVTPQGTAITGR
jgi:hypothetical protein